MNRPRSKSPRRGAATTPADGLAPTTWRAMVRLDGILRRLSEPHFARYGVSGAQWGVLRSLARLEERGRPRPRVRELADEILVQPPSLSATLERMVRAGLVERRDDPQDQRSRLISMTPAGRVLLDRAVPDHLEWVEQMLGALLAAEQSRLRDLLVKLSTHLTTFIESPAGVQRPRRPAKSSRSAP